MEAHWGRSGPLLNSRPCFEKGTLPWRSSLHSQWTEKKLESYNVRNMVPFDRNWGRSSYSVPQVQQAYRWGLNIVDDQHTPMYSGLYQQQSDYRPLAWTTRRDEIQPF